MTVMVIMRYPAKCVSKKYDERHIPTGCNKLINVIITRYYNALIDVCIKT